MARFVILTRWDGVDIAVNPDHVLMVGPRAGRAESESWLQLAAPSDDADISGPLTEAVKGTVGYVIGKLTWRTDGGS